MRILGLNAFHGDSSACIVEDGCLVAAVEEERLRRVKHWAGFPSEAIRACLEIADVNSLTGIDHIAVNQDSQANLLHKISHVIHHRPDVSIILDRVKNRGARHGIRHHLAQAFPGDEFLGSIHKVEHHLAHLSSAFHVSPFNEALALSVDGFGDFASAAWGVGLGAALTVEGRVYFPHSLGIFYQALTQYLGFPHYGDEYKVMGLAAYGQPRQIEAMRRIVHLRTDGTYLLDLAFFRHVREQVPYTWTNGPPQVGDLFTPALEDLLGPRRWSEDPIKDRHRDIAHSVQAMYEEALFHVLNCQYSRHPVENLALAGGCAMNSVANGKITNKTPFKRVYVQSAAGDAGGAVGAALAVWHQLGGDRRSGMEHAYWGPAFSDAEIEALLAYRREELWSDGCTVEHIREDDTLCRQAAGDIAEGRVVGWFQGRMEWGPRALGNRSILCDPRRANMKDILNRKIKRRESFRPFAPSILREAVRDWFEVDDEVPFMTKVFPIREARRAEIPAVTHVDGSGRLQTVSQRANPIYYRLISCFANLTGVPLVLNTSFNENEPVVCRPQEALDCFLRTKMDVLVIGGWMIIRPTI